MKLKTTLILPELQVSRTFSITYQEEYLSKTKKDKQVNTMDNYTVKNIFFKNKTQKNTKKRTKIQKNLKNKQTKKQIKIQKTQYKIKKTTKKNE